MANHSKNKSKNPLKDLGGSKDQAKALAAKIRIVMKAVDIHDANKAEMQRHDVPTKKQNKTKAPAKLTKGTLSSFNAAALKGVPGGSWFKMAHAEHTGCQTLPFDRDALLTAKVSQMNCYTTKSAVHHFGA